MSEPVENFQSSAQAQAEAEACFVEESRRTVDAAPGRQVVFVHQSYNGDDGPDGPEPMPLPPSAQIDEDGLAGNSALNAVMAQINSTVGAGVLSLPFAFQGCGLLGGLILCTLVGAAEALTLYVLSKFGERYHAKTYVELTRRALGRKLAVVVSSVLVVSMFGACIAYMVIIADNFGSLVKALGAPAWATDRRNLISFIGTVIVLPSCFPRELKALAFMNRIAVAAFLGAVAIVTFRGWQVALERKHLFSHDVDLFTFDMGTLFALPIVVFGFNSHSTVVTIFSELDHQPAVLVPGVPSSPSAFRKYKGYLPQPGSRKLIGMVGVILLSTFTVLLAYVSIGSAGYMAYPGHVSGNILVNFPDTDVFVLIARTAVGLVVLGSYPLTHHPARAGFEHLVPWSSKAVSVGFTLAFVGGSIGIALCVSDLGVVLHLVGGVCTTFIIFFLPGLLLINAAVLKHSRAALDELEAAEGATEGGAASARVPLLRLASEKGIKKTGIIYAPRLSWTLGVACVGVSAMVTCITLLTTFVHD